MGRRFSSLERFALAFVVGAALAGAVATAVPAASFDDSTPCPADGALLVCPSGQVDAAYSLQLIGKGGCDLYRWEVVNGALPAGLSMSSGGVISGTPTGAGIARFWVVIHDLLPHEGGHAWCGGDNQSEREFQININPGLVVTTETAPAGVPGSPYSLVLSAATKNGPGQTTPLTSPVTWSLVGGQLPPGLALDGGSGVVSGTPTEQGTFTFVVRAALASGQTATRTLTIVLEAALLLTPPTSIPQTQVGRPVLVEFSASGGTPPYTWRISEGELPAGLVLTQAGVIQGRATTAGEFPFTASVADARGQVQEFSGTFEVAERLAIDKLPLAQARVGRVYRAPLATVGGIAPVTWRVMSGRLPLGVRLNPRLGVLVGKPRRAGRYKVRLAVVDALGVRAGTWYLIRVAPAPAKPKKRPVVRP